MDNKQRINDNTAKIEALAKRLEEASYTDVSDTTATSGDVATGKIFYDKDGVKTEGSGKIAKIIPYGEIYLPEEFATGNTYKIIITSTNKILLVGNSSPYKFVYMLDKDNNSWIKLSEDTFYLSGTFVDDGMGNVVLWNGTSNVDAYIFNNSLNKLVKIQTETDGKYNRNASIYYNGHFFVNGYSNVRRITNIETGETKKLVQLNTSLTFRVINDLFLMSANNQLYIYDNDTDSFIIANDTELSNPSYLYLDMGEAGLFVANYGQTGNNKILKFNFESKKFDVVLDAGDSYLNSLKGLLTNNGDLFICAGANTYKYDKNTNKLNIVIDSGYYGSGGVGMYYSKNKDMLFSYTTSVPNDYLGLYSYNNATGETIKCSTITGVSTYNFIENEEMLLVYTPTSSNGLLKYNDDTNMFDIRVIDSLNGYSGWNIYTNSNGVNFIYSSSTQQGLYRINDDNTSTKIASGLYYADMYEYNGYTYAIGNNHAIWYDSNDNYGQISGIPTGGCSGFIEFNNKLIVVCGVYIYEINEKSGKNIQSNIMATNTYPYIKIFIEDNELYACSKNPDILYKYNKQTEMFENTKKYNTKYASFNIIKNTKFAFIVANNLSQPTIVGEDVSEILFTKYNGNFDIGYLYMDDKALNRVKILYFKE